MNRALYFLAMLAVMFATMLMARQILGLSSDKIQHRYGWNRLNVPLKNHPYAQRGTVQRV